MRIADMSIDERLALANEVFDKAYDELESFRAAGTFGSDLAYLLGAIIAVDDEYAWVDWATDCDDTLALFRQWFPPDHQVWEFIET